MQKLENAIEFYGAISHNKLHGLSVQVETNHVKLPSVVDGFASEGIIQFFFEETGDEKGFNIYILDESNRAEVYHHCEGSKEELVRDVSRFYSSSHDRFTYGSSFINFNLPQFYQIEYRWSRAGHSVPYPAHQRRATGKPGQRRAAVAAVFLVNMMPGGGVTNDARYVGRIGAAPSGNKT